MKPHPEGAFFTVRAWDSDSDSDVDILLAWTRDGRWDPRITRWEVGSREAKERAAAQQAYARFVDGPYGAECPGCAQTVTSHCDGCAACPGMPHAHWCHGDTCICGCPKSRHWGARFGISAGRCRRRKCGCRGFDSVERQGAYLAWCDCTDEEKTERWRQAVGVLMDYAFGLAPGSAPAP